MVGWRAIALDLAVIVTVAATAIAGDIVVAVLIGVGVAVILFVLRMSRSIVRRERYGDSARSRRARDAADSALLAQHGRGILLLELEGPVFFGSAESLSERIDAVLAQGARFVILDFRRVNDLDSTGAHVLLAAHDRAKSRGALLLLAATGAAPHVSVALKDSGVLAAVTKAHLFADSDRALEWAENRLIEALRAAETQAGEYSFRQLDLLAGFTEEERETFRSLLARRIYAAGETVFREGGEGDGLYIIARGSASVKLRADDYGEQRLVTFAAGTAFGEMAMLDSEARSATVQADETLVCYVLDRRGYERVVRDMSPVAIKLLTNLGRELSARLRRANRMLNQLES